MQDGAQHLGFGSGFAGPEFKLARALLDEHLDTLNHGAAALLCGAQQWCFQRIVDKIEDNAGVPLFGQERHGLGIADHATGRGVDQHIKALIGHERAGNGGGTGFVGQFCGGVGVASAEIDAGAFLDQAEDGGTGGSAGSQNQDVGSAQGQAALQRTDDAGDVGIEAVEASVGTEADGVAGTETGAERVKIGQVGHDLLLEGHGDAEAAEGQLADSLQKVVDGVNEQGQVDGVESLAMEGRVLHERGQGVGDGVADDAVDAGGAVDLLDVEAVAHGVGGELAGCGGGGRRGSGEGEGRAAAQAEDAAERTLLAHGEGDDLGACSQLVHPAQEMDVVHEAVGGGDDFEEVGLKGEHAVHDGGRIDEPGEVMEADEERGSGLAQGLAEGLQLDGAGLLGGLDFEIDDGAAGGGSLGEEGQFVLERAAKAAAVRLAAAGGDGEQVAVLGAGLGEESAERGDGGGGFVERVEAELQEMALGEGFFGQEKHLRQALGGQSDGDATDA